MSRTGVTAAAFLTLLAAQVLLALPSKAPTGDELAHHVASGYSYLVKRDFRMNPASPPLPRMLSALPLVFLKLDGHFDSNAWRDGVSPDYAQLFFYEQTHDSDALITWARLPMTVISLLFGLAVFWWSRHLFGKIAAVLSLGLYVFCPDILAHSGLATADLCVAFFFFLTLTAFRSYLKHPSAKHLVLTGLFTGLAFLSKYSAVILLPILLIIALVSGSRRLIAPRKILAFAAVCLLTVWAGYLFEVKPLLKNTPDPVKKTAMYRQIGGGALVSFAEKVPVPLSTFASSFTSMMVTRSRGTDAYLMGEWSRKGWWYYYFIAILIKNTLPMILSVAMGFYFFRRFSLDRVTAATFLVPPALFFLATLGDKAQAGIRYFLPIYPLLIIIAGAGLAWLWRYKTFGRTLVAVLLAWHAAEAVMIFPHHLSYFNELVGGPKNGYLYLRDSNLDWGQDLKGLAADARKNGYGRIALYYPWPARPEAYHIDYRRLTPDELIRPGNAVYAVSAHFMEGVAWTKGVRPDRQIGYSLFIYDRRTG